MKIRLVPANALNNMRNKRNLLEAIIFTLIIAFVICYIPFTTKARIIFLIIFCSASLFFFIRGYKNRSITQIIIAEIKFQNRKRITHLRSADYVANRKTSTLEEAEGETILEKCIFIGKEYIREWKEKTREKLARDFEQGE